MTTVEETQIKLNEKVDKVDKVEEQLKDVALEENNKKGEEEDDIPIPTTTIETVESLKEEKVNSDEEKVDENSDIAPFTKDDENHPVLVLASTVPVPEKTKLNIEPTPALNIPTRPDPSKGSANLIFIAKVNPKEVGANTLGPREQEKEDEPVLRGLRHLLNNRFMSAKTLFEQKADSDPLFALALSSMGFLKGNTLTNYLY
ncbi:unnamed protein product [Cunninghamella echinulata]